MTFIFLMRVAPGCTEGHRKSISARFRRDLPQARVDLPLHLRFLPLFLPHRPFDVEGNHLRVELAKQRSVVRKPGAAGTPTWNVPLVVGAVPKGHRGVKDQADHKVLTGLRGVLLLVVRKDLRAVLLRVVQRLPKGLKVRADQEGAKDPQEVRILEGRPVLAGVRGPGVLKGQAVLSHHWGTTSVVLRAQDSAEPLRAAPFPCRSVKKFVESHLLVPPPLLQRAISAAAMNVATVEMISVGHRERLVKQFPQPHAFVVWEGAPLHNRICRQAL